MVSLDTADVVRDVSNLSASSTPDCRVSTNQIASSIAARLRCMWRCVVDRSACPVSFSRTRFIRTDQLESIGMVKPHRNGLHSIVGTPMRPHLLGVYRGARRRAGERIKHRKRGFLMYLQPRTRSGTRVAAEVRIRTYNASSSPGTIFTATARFKAPTSRLRKRRPVEALWFSPIVSLCSCSCR
jgi:hypothetical protein